MKPVQNPSAKPSKVYFTDFHATPSETLPQKLHQQLQVILHQHKHHKFD